MYTYVYGIVLVRESRPGVNQILDVWGLTMEEKGLRINRGRKI